MEKLIREYEENGQLMQEFEVITDSGKRHIIRKPIPIESEQPETLEDKLSRLEQDNLILMDALATVYEELLTLKSGGVV